MIDDITEETPDAGTVVEQAETSEEVHDDDVKEDEVVEIEASDDEASDEVADEDEKEA